MEPTILYEDDELVAIDKPAGMMTHPDGHSSEETVSDWFLARYPHAHDVGEQQTLVNGTVITRPGIVHRLDKETSGVLLLAKTKAAHARLKELFKNRDIQKTYVAFTYGAPKERTGTITLPIGRSRRDFRLRSAQRGAKGMLREAITDYEVVSDIGSHALMLVRPRTGRTHQIRVHLKALHHPIVADPLYAPTKKADLGFPRLGLHAYQIEVPREGESLRITAPIPADLATALPRFGETGLLVARA